MFKKIKFSPQPFSKKVLLVGFEAGAMMQLCAALFGILYKTSGGQLNRFLCTQLISTGLRLFIMTALLFLIFEFILKPNK